MRKRKNTMPAPPPPNLTKRLIAFAIGALPAMSIAIFVGFWAWKFSQLERRVDKIEKKSATITIEFTNPSSSTIWIPREQLERQWDIEPAPDSGMKKRKNDA